jgi:hypothetical protein
MKCPQCHSLSPEGAPRCSLCGAVLPATPADRRASTYLGLHSVVDDNGRPIRAFLDLGARPVPNLLLGLAICALFALSAVPTILAESTRRPESIARLLTTRESGDLFVYLVIVDDSARPMSIAGLARVSVWAAADGADVSRPVSLGTSDQSLAREDFRSGAVVYTDPETGEEQRMVVPMARLGPLPDRTPSAGPDGLVQISVEITGAGGLHLQATTDWTAPRQREDEGA